MSDSEYATIRSLYDLGLAPSSARLDSISTLRMKAIELYSRAGRVVSGGSEHNVPPLVIIALTHR